MKIFALMMVVTLVGFSESFAAKGKFDGNWDYQADYAPEGYRKGTISINGTELALKINNQQTFSGKDVKLEDDTLSFYTYVEGNRVDIKLTLKEGKLSGVATYPEGNIPLKLTKQK